MFIRVQLHLGLPELPSRDLTFEQNVELVITSILEFWESEECPNEAGETEGCPEETGLKKGRIQSVRCCLGIIA